MLVSTYSLSKEMTLREMVANLVIIGFEGTKLSNNPSLVNDISNGLGGVVIFDKDPQTKGVKNIKSPMQLKILTNKLQKFGKNRLIIAIDQEGGKVQRLRAKNGFISTPSAVDISKMSYEEAKAYYSRVSRVLYENKINLNFAPVVDLATQKKNRVIYGLKRSYGRDPIKVTKYASIFIDEMRKYGVIATLKHFPGHGSSLADSHKGFVDITKSWSVKELDPYYRLIKQNRVDVVMTAHVYNKNLDYIYPATMSYRVNTTILREILGFNGVVISDDLQMRAISDNYSLEDAIMNTLNSGVDLLLFANQNRDKISLNKILNIVERLVKEQKLTKSRIKEAYKRVQKLKNKVEKFNKLKIKKRQRIVEIKDISIKTINE